MDFDDGSQAATPLEPGTPVGERIGSDYPPPALLHTESGTTASGLPTPSSHAVGLDQRIASLEMRAAQSELRMDAKMDVIIEMLQQQAKLNTAGQVLPNPVVTHDSSAFESSHSIFAVNTPSARKHASRLPGVATTENSLLVRQESMMRSGMLRGRGAEASAPRRPASKSPNPMMFARGEHSETGSPPKPSSPRSGAQQSSAFSSTQPGRGKRASVVQFTEDVQPGSGHGKKQLDDASGSSASMLDLPDLMDAHDEIEAEAEEQSVAAKNAAAVNDVVAKLIVSPASDNHSHNTSAVSVASATLGDKGVSSGNLVEGSMRTRRTRSTAAGNSNSSGLFARMDERFPLVDADDNIVFVSDVVYIVLSFVVCCVAALTLNDFSAQAQEWPVILLVCVVLAYSAYWMVLRGRYTRVIVGEWGVTDTAAEVARHYVRSWLALDVFVALPLELLFLGWLPIGFRFALMRHFVRFIRVYTLIPSSNPLLPSRPRFRFFCLIGTIAILLVLFAMAFGFLEDYTVLEAVYWATATLSSTGYGDIVPRESRGQTFSIVAMLLSMAAVSTLQAFSTSLLTNRDIVAEDIDLRKKTMHSMLQHYDIPRALQKQVIGCFPEVLEAQRKHRFADMAEDLPPLVAEELEAFVHIREVKSLRIFAPVFSSGLPTDACARAIATVLTSRVAVANEFIFKLEEMCVELLVIQSGVVELIRLLDDEEVVELVVRRGNTMGAACLRGDPVDRVWNAAAQAVLRTHYLSLNNNDFYDVASQHPILNQLDVDCVADFTSPSAFARSRPTAGFTFGESGTFGSGTAPSMTFDVPTITTSNTTSDHRLGMLRRSGGRDEGPPQTHRRSDASAFAFSEEKRNSDSTGGIRRNSGTFVRRRRKTLHSMPSSVGDLDPESVASGGSRNQSRSISPARMHANLLLSTDQMHPSLVSPHRVPSARTDVFEEEGDGSDCGEGDSVRVMSA
jgi:hypothetical protein